MQKTKEFYEKLPAGVYKATITANQQLTSVYLLKDVKGMFWRFGKNIAYSATLVEDLGILSFNEVERFENPEYRGNSL